MRFCALQAVFPRKGTLHVHLMGVRGSAVGRSSGEGALVRETASRPSGCHQHVSPWGQHRPEREQKHPQSIQHNLPWCSAITSPVASLCPPGVCAVNGLLYVVGGDDGSCNLASVEYYNPITDKWTLLPTNMSTGRSYAGQWVAVLLATREVRQDARMWAW